MSEIVNFDPPHATYTVEQALAMAAKRGAQRVIIITYGAADAPDAGQGTYFGGPLTNADAVWLLERARLRVLADSDDVQEFVPGGGA